jgi:2-oxoglutarate ferredoxin oxidoreductase subunit alpha
MMDECVGHMTEKVIIPEADQIEIAPRNYYQGSRKSYKPFSFNGQYDVAPMVKAGDGYFFHITGLTHDERGYPMINAEAQAINVKHLVDKIRKNEDKIRIVEHDQLVDADVVVISYGISSRVALKAVEEARKKKIKVGTIRLITVWPFPENIIRQLASKVKAFVVPEINMGQISLEVERCAEGNARTILVPHAGGWVHNPKTILEAIEEGTS